MPEPAPKADANDLELAELRRLLVGTEQLRLEQVEHRLDDPKVRARETGAVLADAIASRDPADRQLREAMAPLFQEAFRVAVQRHPQVIVDVLFPIILPAIRRSVAEALRGMVESLNRILEDAFSLRGLKWRFEALRTGRSFAEVALSKSLVYRVEGVYLIHRETGLLLASAQAGDALRDSTLVSGMLTAMQDFVRDSLKASESDGLERVKFGDFYLVREQGSQAALVAVIKGSAPTEYRETLEDALAEIHRTHARDWERFNGDTQIFDASQPVLEACLQAQYESRESAGLGRLAIAGAVVAILLAAWMIPRYLEQVRWDRHVEALRAEPGIVVTESGKRNGRWQVSGLRDPAAIDPQSILSQSLLLPEQVSYDFEPYYSYDPALVERRARNFLSAPETVELTIRDGRLTATGSAPNVWIRSASRQASSVPGVTAADFSQVKDADRVSLEGAIRSLADERVRFEVGSTRLVAGARDQVSAVSSRVAQLARTARSLGFQPRLRVLGHADMQGTAAANEQLSTARAAALLNLMVRDGVPADLLVARGMGSEPPPGAGADDLEKNRVARLEMTISQPVQQEAGP